MTCTKRKPLAWLAAAIVFFFAGDAHSETIQPDPVDGKIKWVYRYEDGKQEARRTGKPLFVVFRCER